jgi:hypothetical protein
MANMNKSFKFPVIKEKDKTKVSNLYFTFAFESKCDDCYSFYFGHLLGR